MKHSLGCGGAKDCSCACEKQSVGGAQWYHDGEAVNQRVPRKVKPAGVMAGANDFTADDVPTDAVIDVAGSIFGLDEKTRAQVKDPVNRLKSAVGGGPSLEGRKLFGRIQQNWMKLEVGVLHNENAPTVAKKAVKAAQEEWQSFARQWANGIHHERQLMGLLRTSESLLRSYHGLEKKADVKESKAEKPRVRIQIDKYRTVKAVAKGVGIAAGGAALVGVGLLLAHGLSSGS